MNGRMLEGLYLGHELNFTFQCKGWNGFIRREDPIELGKFGTVCFERMFFRGRKEENIISSILGEDPARLKRGR